MDTNQLKYFMEVCETGSFSKAAENSFITQQALSSSIKRLERELNAVLFERTNKGVQPTKDGLFFKESAMRILEEENHIKQALSITKPMPPNLTIACAFGTVWMLEQKLLNRQALLERGLRLKIYEHADLDCEDAILNGDVEMGLSIGPIDDRLFDSYYLMTREPCLIAPVSHVLSQYDVITPEMLRDENIITINNRFKMHDILQNVALSRGVELNYSHEVGELEPVQRLVEKKYGIGINLKVIAETLDKNVFKILSLDDPAFRWDVFLITRKNKNLSEQGQRLKDYLLNS